ncbi:M48 family metalloprotease [Shimia sp. R11_0]|uniref:M48 family metalloprotease n=1 Tax=Shimia sp. R11_0 TaxID=2821096 RepID=UPI001ADC8CB8|nr:M48 family metalloprotease [Shimia sp. R11_0]MBO9478979.1 M48 family metalloprotease [Shimia sp. R11_0]
MVHSNRNRAIGALVFAGVVLQACVSTTTSPTPQPSPQAAPQPKVEKISYSQAVSRLAPIKARMEPIVERECKARTTSGTNCDYLISVDKEETKIANAYQTLDKNGRPLIIFTAPLIAETRNAHELAFVMGHEAAHHIGGHIARQQTNASFGALAGGLLIAAAGGDASSVQAAMDLGATVGARSYSKQHELEADSLGTVLTHKSGYDPLIGVNFFERTPDPGNQFLGTHPPNSARINVVRQTAAGL